MQDRQDSFTEFGLAWCRTGGRTWLRLSLTSALVNRDTGLRGGVQINLLACVGMVSLTMEHTQLVHVTWAGHDG